MSDLAKGNINDGSSLESNPSTSQGERRKIGPGEG